jgi:hypothetical protein
MPILVGVDGTGGDIFRGTARDARYDQVFETSFVRKLCLPATPTNATANRIYIRGPALLGGGMPEGIAQGMNFIESSRRRFPNEPILLAGYSRGALGAANLARLLKGPPHNINVKAMLLFDCVDMHLAYDAEEITDNVGHVLHVVLTTGVRSRSTWHRAARRAKSPAVYGSVDFRCTHAGIGGVPWPLPMRREPERPTLGGSIPAREFLDHSRQNEFINEGGLDGETNITYAQDKHVSEQILNHKDVRSFIRQHGFQ